MRKPKRPRWYPACPACTSPHRAELDRQLAEGIRSADVAARLEELHGEAIEPAVLLEHKRDHLDCLATLATARRSTP